MNLRDISLLWSLIHILVLFIFFYESRYSRKKTIILTCLFMIPLGALNIAGLLKYGSEIMGKLILLTCTVPSAVFFFIIAKNRNGKFLFTFCLVDTISYEVLVLTNFLEEIIPGEGFVVMFVTRLIAFPLMELVGYRYLRKPYLKLQSSVEKGWGMFTILGGMYYVLLLLMTHFPTMITNRPQDFPAYAVMFLLMPATYGCVFVLLKSQSSLAEAHERERTLVLQSNMLSERIEQMSEMEEKMRLIRHDIRHKYSILTAMLEKGEIDSAKEYITGANRKIDEAAMEKYCENSTIDAVFMVFVNRAREKGIRIEADIDIKSDLSVDAAELSVVFANALENAINACLKLPEDKREIKCKCKSEPHLLIRISNPFVGELLFDSKGLPLSNEEFHGTGVRSIAAFCEKYDAFCEFKVDNGIFTLGISCE